MHVRARTTLPPSVGTPAAARAFVRETLHPGSSDVRVDDVALVVSELVTNAVLHGDGDIMLNVVVADDAVHVEVADAAPALPAPRAAPSDADSGRGLFIVDGVATRWGVRPAARGKVVWADLAG